MGDKKFTFIELHLDGDTQFGPRSLPELVTGDTEADEEHEDVETDEADVAAAADDDSGGNGAIAVVLGLAALVAIGVAVKKFRGGDDGEREEYDEPDVIVN